MKWSTCAILSVESNKYIVHQNINLVHISLHIYWVKPCQFITLLSLSICPESYSPLISSIWKLLFWCLVFHFLIEAHFKNLLMTVDTHNVFFLVISIGHINPELYALGADSWNSDASQKLSESDVWMQNYANALCINSWQVLAESYILNYKLLFLQLFCWNLAIQLWNGPWWCNSKVRIPPFPGCSIYSFLLRIFVDLKNTAFFLLLVSFNIILVWTFENPMLTL